MILINSKVLISYLKIIGRNQSWLAKELGYTKGYLSQVVNNRCKMSRDFIEKILRFTHIRFDILFIMDGEKDSREFYGSQIYFDGIGLDKDQYKLKISSKIQNNPLTSEKESDIK